MKIIRFYSHEKYKLNGSPVPSKRSLPTWFKDAESTFLPPGGTEPQAGLKKCMPFFDAMVSGYYITMPANITVSKNKNGDVQFFSDDPLFDDFIGERHGDIGSTMPRPEGFLQNHFVFKNFWSWKTPRSWSVLVTHPLNSWNLPFATSSAIMDSDEFVGPGNIPFFLNENFEGVIPKGTPIAQLIPIKRSSWSMIQNDISLKDVADTKVHIVRGKDTPYKKIMWHRKKYD
jgi:hypothetical protein